MLTLAQSQIMAAMSEAETSVAELTEVFTMVNHHAQQLVQLTTEATSEPYQHHSQLLDQQTQHAVVGFQFHDQLAQRMSHVLQLLHQMAQILGDPERRNSRTDWAELQQYIQSQYTVSAEQTVHDAVMEGASAEQAAKQSSVAQPESDIELF